MCLSPTPDPRKGTLLDKLGPHIAVPQAKKATGAPKTPSRSKFFCLSSRLAPEIWQACCPKSTSLFQPLGQRFSTYGPRTTRTCIRIMWTLCFLHMQMRSPHPAPTESRSLGGGVILQHHQWRLTSKSSLFSQFICMFLPLFSSSSLKSLVQSFILNVPLQVHCVLQFYCVPPGNSLPIHPNTSLKSLPLSSHYNFLITSPTTL